jgi:opacity protein-like surface antigen
MTDSQGSGYWALVGWLLLMFATTGHRAEAQVLGVQASYAKDAAGLLWGEGIDTQFGVGVRVEQSLASLSLPGPFASARALGSFDYFFPNCEAMRGGATSCSYWELNANVATQVGSGPLSPYVGAGLSFAGSSFTTPAFDPTGPTSATTSNSLIETGVNLLGGVRYVLGAMSLYTEARIEVGGGEQFVLSSGVLFGR